jgi:hypothetical protein
MTRITVSARRICLMSLMSLLCGICATAAHAQFTVSVSPNPATVRTEYSVPLTLTLTSQAGWTGQVFLECANLPEYASCTFPPGQGGVSVAASAPTTLTVDLQTSAIYNYEGKLHQNRMQTVALCSLFAPAMCWLFLGGRRRKKAAGLMLFTLVLLPIAGLSGCGNVKPPSTPPGTYNGDKSIYFEGNPSSSSAGCAPNTCAALSLIVTP